MQADSLGWEEGVGFVAFLGVAAIVGLAEIVALVMGWLGTKSTVGKIAGAAAALGLALVLWVVVLAMRQLGQGRTPRSTPGDQVVDGGGPNVWPETVGAGLLVLGLGHRRRGVVVSA